MNEWFQWGYDGCNPEQMQRLLVRTNDDGRESDDDGHLLGECDDGARCFGGLDQQTTRRRRSRKERPAGRARARAEGVALVVLDDAADTDATSSAWSEASSEEPVRPPTVVAASAPVVIASLPPVLLGHSAVVCPLANGHSVVLIHGGAAAADLLPQALRSGGGFVDGSFVTQRTSFAGHINGTKSIASFTELTTITAVRGPSVYGHCAVALPPAPTPSASQVPTSARSIVGFGSASGHLTDFHEHAQVVADLWLASTVGSPNCTGIEWEPLSVVGAPLRPRALASMCVTGTSQSLRARDTGENDSAWVTVETGAAADEFHTKGGGEEAISLVVFGGCGPKGEPLGDLIAVTCFVASRTAFVRHLDEDAVGGFAPSPRYGHSATLTPRGDMVVFGGVGSEREYLADCFILEGAGGAADGRDDVPWAWREVLLPGTFAVPPRAFHSAQWVEHLQAVMLCGGEVNETAVQSIWALRVGDESWSQIERGNVQNQRFAHSGAMVASVVIADDASSRGIDTRDGGCEWMSFGGVCVATMRRARSGFGGEAAALPSTGCKGERMRCARSLRFFAATALARILDTDTDDITRA